MALEEPVCTTIFNLHDESQTWYAFTSIVSNKWFLEFLGNVSTVLMLIVSGVDIFEWFLAKDSEDENNGSNDSADEGVNTMIQKKSSEIPNSSTNATLEYVIDLVRTGVAQFPNQCIPTCNKLSANERDSLQQLWQQNDIIKKLTEKGSAIVVNKIKYIKEAARQCTRIFLNICNKTSYS